jgi:hypothetical protein
MRARLAVLVLGGLMLVSSWAQEIEIKATNPGTGDAVVSSVTVAAEIKISATMGADTKELGAMAMRKESKVAYEVLEDKDGLPVKIKATVQAYKEIEQGPGQPPAEKASPFVGKTFIMSYVGGDDGVKITDEAGAEVPEDQLDGLEDLLEEDFVIPESHAARKKIFAKTWKVGEKATVSGEDAKNLLNIDDAEELRLEFTLTGIEEAPEGKMAVFNMVLAGTLDMDGVPATIKMEGPAYVHAESAWMMKGHFKGPMTATSTQKADDGSEITMKMAGTFEIVGMLSDK